MILSTEVGGGVPGPGGGAWSWEGVSGPGGVPGWRPPPQDSYCCGWYSSYWNAFLFVKILEKPQ